MELAVVCLSLLGVLRDQFGVVVRCKSRVGWTFDGTLAEKARQVPSDAVSYPKKPVDRGSPLSRCAAALPQRPDLLHLENSRFVDVLRAGLGLKSFKPLFKTGDVCLRGTQ